MARNGLAALALLSVLCLSAAHAHASAKYTREGHMAAGKYKRGPLRSLTARPSGPRPSAPSKSGAERKNDAAHVDRPTSGGLNAPDSDVQDLVAIEGAGGAGGLHGRGETMALRDEHEEMIHDDGKEAGVEAQSGMSDEAVDHDDGDEDHDEDEDGDGDGDGDESHEEGDDSDDDEAETGLGVGELTSGYILNTTMDEAAQAITIKVDNSKNSWVAFGLTTPGGGMTAGGAGAEIYICTTDGGLKRYWVTDHSTPTNGVAVDGECTFMDGTTSMSFSMPVGTAMRRAEGTQHYHAMPGTMQSVIFAYGADGDTTLASIHARDGEREVDLGDISKGFVTNKRPAEWTLWIHLVFMTLAWGWFLPWGAAIASRAKAVAAQPVGQWFKVHVHLQAAGWLLSLIGFAFALAHAELFSTHFHTPHTIIGIVCVVLCFLQPVNAFLRPHPPSPEGFPNGAKPLSRTIWEVVHKGLGWATVLLGMANVIVGAILTLDLNYDPAAAGVALGLGCFGMLTMLLFMALSTISPQNTLSRALVRGGQGGGGVEAPDIPSGVPQAGHKESDGAVYASPGAPPSGMFPQGVQTGKLMVPPAPEGAGERKESYHYDT